MSRIPAFLLLGLLTVAARTARAELELEYDAPASCPGESEFRAEFARSMQGSAVAASQFAYAVVIREHAGVHRGSLRVPVSPGADDALREVEDRDCREVIHALAFIAAVLADPDAAERNREAPPVTPEVEPTPKPAVEPSTAPKPRPPPPPVGAAARPRGADISAKPQPITGTAPPLRASRGWHAAVTAAAVTESALAPDLAFAPRLGLLARRGSLVLALSGTFGNSGDLTGGVGSAELSWIRLRGEGCGALALSARFEVQACGSFDGGRYEGVGSRAPFTDTRAAAWLAPGMLGRLALGLGRIIELSAEAGAFVPLVRPRFVVESPRGNQVLHAVPVVGFSAGLGVLAYLL